MYCTTWRNAKVRRAISQKIGNAFGDGSEDDMKELLPPYGDLYEDKDLVEIANSDKTLADADNYAPESYDEKSLQN